MALSKATGTNASWGTEYFLLSGSTTMTAVTTDARVQVYIDLSALIAGDQYKITIYEKVNGGTAIAVLDPSHPTGVQSTHYVSPILSLDEGYDVGIKRIAGSDRTITWSVRSSDDLGGGATAANQSTIISTLATIAAYIDTEVASIKTTVEALPSAAAVATAVMAVAHESGRTVLGVFRRLDALMTGKATGLISSLATFYRADGTTKAIEATQDTALGTRSTASTVGGD